MEENKLQKNSNVSVGIIILILNILELIAVLRFLLWYGAPPHSIYINNIIEFFVPVLFIVNIIYSLKLKKDNNKIISTVAYRVFLYFAIIFGVMIFSVIMGVLAWMNVH
jgi:hypothetical protein